MHQAANTSNSDTHRSLQNCGSSVQNLLHVTLLAPILLRRLYDFWKNLWAPVLQNNITQLHRAVCTTSWLWGRKLNLQETNLWLWNSNMIRKRKAGTKTKVTADSPFNWTSQKHIKCMVEIHTRTSRRILSKCTPTQYNMLPQHPINVRKLISECF